MTAPQVQLTTIDGALGVLPPSAGRMLCIMGPADSGTNNVPVALARTKNLTDAFTSGPLVRAGAYALEQYGRPVLFIKTAASTAATNGTLDKTTVTGTSVVSVSAGTLGNDNADVVVKIANGGTVATAGITYQVSLDGGQQFGPIKALGTANTIAITGFGTLSFALAAGTLVTGDYWTLPCRGPAANSADLAAALTALSATSQPWEMVYLASPVDATIGATLDAAMTSMAAKGKYHWWIGGTRILTAAESDATYQTAMAAITGSYSSTYGAAAAGDCWTVSSVPGQAFNFTSPPALSIAAKLANTSEEVDIAQIDQPGGPLPGVQIRDANGNPIKHDEQETPGLDDLRLISLRSWDGYQGVYVTNPRMLSPTGSDFEFVQHRRVFNIFQDTLYRYFVKRLSKPIRVNAKTGLILEEEALEIEAGATSACRSVLLEKPKASAVSVVVSRTDNLLSTKTLTIDARLTPLAYPKFIQISTGFVNPALRLVKA